MSRNIANFLCYLFILAVVLCAAWLYPELPDLVPSHWNVDGEVDGYLPKPWGVVLLPGLAIFVFVVFRLIPVISPRVFASEAFSNAVHGFQVLMVAFMAMVGFLVMFEAKGVDVHINRMILAGIGVLFLVCGSYMRRIPRNFFIGIRTPWTLASNEVWERTHRLGGWLFMLLGGVYLWGAMFSINVVLLVGVVVAVAIVAIVYSYVSYRRVRP